MADVYEWLANKLASSLPRTDLSPGDAGRDVRNLAEAVAALEGRTSSVFGLHLKPEDRERCSSLACDFREGLKKWKTFLTEQVGNEAIKFVEDIASEYGVRLGLAAELRCGPPGSVDLLDDLAKGAVDQLANALSAPATLTEIWRKEGRLVDDSDGVRVRLGKPDETALKELAEAYERTFEQAFPVLVAHLLSRFNGIAVGSDEPSGTPSETVPPRELSEPVWWPANAYGDHFMLLDADIDDSLDFFVVGELADSGYLCLGLSAAAADVDDDIKPEGPPVYWLDRSLSSTISHLLATNTAAFIREWVADALSLHLTLKRCHVPGWG